MVWLKELNSILITKEGFKWSRIIIYCFDEVINLFLKDLIDYILKFF